MTFRFKVPPSPEVRRAWDSGMRNRLGTVSCEAGDLMAIKLLGVHPCAVWGDDWWTAAATPSPEPRRKRGARFGGRLPADTRHAIAEQLLGSRRQAQAIARQFGCTYEQVRTVDRQLHALDGRPKRTKAAA